MMEVKCPTCGKHLEIDPKYLGQSGRCNNCGGLVYAVEPRPIPKTISKPRSRTKKVVLFLLLIPIVIGLMVLNAFVYFDVSKPITYTESAAAAAMPPMHDSLFEEIRVSAYLPFSKSYFRQDSPEIRAEIASQELVASKLPLNEYTESLKGRTVSWYGLVLESRQRLVGGYGARRKLIGGYEVWIDADRNGIQDVLFDVSGATARSLSKGQCVAFEGTIQSVTTDPPFFQVNLVNARITTTYASEITPEESSNAPGPIQEASYYQFTDQHRWAAISALRSAGLPQPKFIGFQLDMILADIEISDQQLKNLGGFPPEIGQKAVLAIRNAIYVMPGADPKWNYAVRVLGETPGPDLEFIRGGSFLLGSSGSVEWLNGRDLVDLLK